MRAPKKALEEDRRAREPRLGEDRITPSPSVGLEKLATSKGRTWAGLPGTGQGQGRAPS